MTLIVPEIRTASAVKKPCQLRKYHSPTPIITQGHHRFPVFLQHRVYGGKVQVHDLLWVCGTDHDSIHAWLYYLLGERARPEGVANGLALGEAQRAFAWYTDAK